MSPQVFTHLWVIYWVSQTKSIVWQVYNIMKLYNTAIFWGIIKTTFMLMCVKFSTPYVNRNLSYDCERNDGSNWTWMNTLVFKFVVLSSKSHLTDYSSQINNFSYVWHMELNLKFKTQLDEICIYQFYKILHILNTLSTTGLLTPYIIGYYRDLVIS